MIKTVCYGEEKLWESRWDAIDFFFQGMVECDGEERDRYTNIYIQLMTGKEECFDSRRG